MKIHVAGIAENPVSLMRRAGYAFQHEEGGEMSFVRTLGQSGSPRFHCYTKLDTVSLLAHLHLDQKKHTYGAGTRHHGEYEDSEAVTEEASHLLKVFGEKAKII